MSASTDLAHPGLHQFLIEAWRQWRRRFAARSELAALGSETADIARDCNVSVSELAQLSGLRSDSAALLDKRLDLLGLSSAAQRDRAVMRDLQRTCSSCCLKARCTRDLESEQGVAAVADYCPNEHTLQALRRAEDTVRR